VVAQCANNSNSSLLEALDWLSEDLTNHSNKSEDCIHFTDEEQGLLTGGETAILLHVHLVYFI